MMVPFDGAVANFYEGRLYEIHPELRVMQFTGLKDERGKEIYEDDIIELCSYIAEDGSKIDREVRVVRWFGDDGYPAFDLDGWDHESNGLSELTQSGEWKYEVIGNIYENPELLKSST